MDGRQKRIFNGKIESEIAEKMSNNCRSNKTFATQVKKSCYFLKKVFDKPDQRLSLEKDLIVCK